MTHLYDIFETRFAGPTSGNPFRDVKLEAHFSLGNRTVRVTGFYDGEGEYVIRFMPDTVGDWSYVTRSNEPELDGKSGTLTVTEAREGVHGPVQVRNKFHFAYADGTPYYALGTTCYAWTHQPLEMQAQTLDSLKSTAFNKIRMAVFPKDYPYNENPALYPIFEEREDGSMDFDRPNPVAFRHLEKQIAELAVLGIEADLILFHPYDRWNYATMSEAQNLAYVEYVAARLSAHRNVWWALANEYDFLLDTIPLATWDRIFHILEEHDHVGHLRSIHNGEVTMNYNHRQPWVTHVCIQNCDVKKTTDWREDYGKPVVNDELEYEGNLWQSWGSISAQELVHRFWITVTKGGYAGHGETYSDPEDLIWWAKGGVLKGESWQRIGFLHNLMREDQLEGLEPLGGTDSYPWNRVSGAKDLGGKVTYIYFGEHQPEQWTTGLPTDDGEYETDLIDTWNMTITPAKKIPAYVPHPTRHGDIVRGGKADAAFGVELPSKPYMALRVRKIG